MKKFSPIHIAALLAGILLIVSFSLRMNTSVTFYGFAENKRCQMPCSRENSKFCGGGSANLIYDLRYLNRAN